MKGRLLTAVLVVSASLACGASASPGALTACTAKMLTGTFRVIPGSAGAGHIAYALRLRNSSHAGCFVTGIPGLMLLDARGRALPTHATPAHPGMLTAVIVRLAPGRSARATAYFSPDVPGLGEQAPGACERTAEGLRVAPSGGGTLVAPVAPPTPVCEQGAMTMTVLTAA